MREVTYKWVGSFDGGHYQFYDKITGEKLNSCMDGEFNEGKREAEEMPPRNE